MGLLYICDACEQCGYQSRHLLRYHLGEMGVFMGIVSCRTCADVVSLFPAYDNIPDAVAATLGGAVRSMRHADAVAKGHAALFPSGAMIFDTCMVCGGHEIYHHHIWLPRYNVGGRIRLPCPRCATGGVMLVPAGTWD